MTQTQAVRNELVKSDAAMLAQRRELAGTEVRLGAARSRSDELSVMIGQVARELYTDRSTDAPLGGDGLFSSRRLLKSIGARQPAHADFDTYQQVSREVGRLEAASGAAGAELARLTAEATRLRAALAEHEAAAAALQERVNLVADTTVQSDEPLVAFTGGRLQRPVPGRLSSNFGSRFDPYYKVWQLHAGADIAAPAGTPIRAAAQGRVLRAGWNGGYGNYTCLEHGIVAEQRLLTCYAHQSQILVTAGDVVGPGQPIGLVGSTGASTGPHLHFEVRLGGRPVDPLPWLQ